MEEIWRPIIKFNSEYEVSDLGRIRSTFKIIQRSCGKTHTRVSKILKPSISDFYEKGAVCVNKKMIPYKLHRLVAEAFIPNTENKPTVNHINGIKHDNRVVNLEWATQKEQMIHATKTGLLTHKKGEEASWSIATEQKVKEIRDYVLYQRSVGNTKYGRKDLAEKHNLTVSCVKDIITRRSWKHIH